MNYDTILPLMATAGVGGWFGKAGIAWISGRGATQKAKIDGDVLMKKHTDDLMFQMLSAAQGQVAALNARVNELQPLVAEVAHLSEALDHIAALLASDTSEEKRAAERRAQAFLNRMRRLGDARGALLNEAQIKASADRLPPDMTETLGRMP